MSRTTLYAVNTERDLVTLEEFGNGWRSAPMLWDHLLARLKLGDPSLPGMVRWGMLWGDEPRGLLDAIVPRERTPAEEAARARREADVQARLFDEEWWALATTMDRHVVAARCARQLSEALRCVHDSCVLSFPPRLPSSFAEQADAIDRATDTEPETTGLFGFAWNQTSVSCTWPWTELEDGDELRPNLDREGNYYLVTGLRKVEYVPGKVKA